MNNSVLLFFTLTAILVLTGQATPVNTTSVQPSPSPTPDSEQQHVSMVTYNEMVRNVVSVQQEVWILKERLSSNNSVNYTAQQFEYCFLKDVANPPGKNLTVRNVLRILCLKYIAIIILYI